METFLTIIMEHFYTAQWNWSVPKHSKQAVRQQMSGGTGGAQLVEFLKNKL